MVMLLANAANAQPTFFNCNALFILNSVPTNIIAQCDTSFTLFVGMPIPAKAPSASAEHPIKLWKSVASQSGTDSLVEIKIAVRINSLRGTIEVIPKEDFPTYTEGDPLPTLYRVSIDCRWWDSNAHPDSSINYLSKDNVIEYRSEARLLEDGSRLPTNFTRPTLTTEIIKKTWAVGIGLDSPTSGYRFLYWTSSHNSFDFIPNLSDQTINTGCWPLSDTVVFTAWFSRTSDVETSGVLNEQIAARWDKANGRLLLEGLQPQPTQVYVYDLQGLLTYQTLLVQPAYNQSVQLSLNPGVHLVLIRQNNAVHVLRCLAY